MMKSIVIVGALTANFSVAFVSLPKNHHHRSPDLNDSLFSATQDEEVTLNPIVASVKVSKTVEVFGLVKQMEAEGETVTSLCVGEPDFPPPQAVLDAATRAIAEGETRYTAVTGTADLRNAIAGDLERRKGLKYNPMTEIIVGNGVSPILLSI